MNVDIRRIILYLALALLGVLLVEAWFKDYPPTAQTGTTHALVATKKSGDYSPPAFRPGASSPQEKSKSTKAPAVNGVKEGRLILVQTDVLNLAINLWGGNLVVAKLPKYPVSLKESNNPVQILTNDPAKVYVAQSGITNSSNRGQSELIHYQATQSRYALSSGQNKLVVSLKGKTENGLTIIKSFTFVRGKYAITQNFKITNQSAHTWKGSVYNQITRRNVPVKSSFHSRSYNGASISSPEKPYEKLSFKDLRNNNVSRTIKGGWIAMQQHYFLSAWVPNQKQEHHFYSHVTNAKTDSEHKVYTIGYVSPEVAIAPGATQESQSSFYVGPEIAKQLSPLSSTLTRTVDYGWLWWLSGPIFWVMAKIHAVMGNWGWSIIFVTLLIKLVFFPLSAKSYRSMAKMRLVQPRLKALKEQYGGDKQALSRATMDFYKKEKVNPMGGCLPILVQIPVFFALYYVLIEAVQLRQAPFIFWIHNLSIKDPYFILPVLMGISMFLQQKLSPPPPDPTQAKVMMLLPVIFTVFFATFPAGLVLYWLTNNCISIAQQWWIMKTYKNIPVKKPKKKKHK